jgi:site-specific recombinase XerD
MMTEPTSHMQSVRRNVFVNPELLDLTSRQLSSVLVVLLAFLEEHKPRVYQILLGEAPGNWTPQDLRELEYLVHEETIDTDVAMDFLRVLRKACRHYTVRERLPLELPRIPVLPTQPKSPFRVNYGKAKRRHNAWKHTLASQIRATKANEDREIVDPDTEVAKLTVSAILYGGILNLASLCALIRAVTQLPKNTFAVDGRIHVELSLSWRGVPDMECRRWQPDALTATFLMRTPPEAVASLLANDANGDPCSDKELIKRITKLIDVKFKRAAGKNASLLLGLKSLIQAAQVVAYTEIPCILAAYAARKFVSQSIDRSTLQRLSSDKLICMSNSQPSEEVQSGESMLAASRSITSAAEDDDEDYVLALRCAMNGTDRSTIRHQLQSIVSGDPFVKRIADLADSLLATGFGTRKMPDVSTITDAVLLITRHMGCFLAGRDPADMSTEMLESVYVRMIESTGPLKEKSTLQNWKFLQNLAAVILQFHQYMMARFEKEPIEDRGLLMIASGLDRVDANIITFEEYREILQRIDRTWPVTLFPERRQIARVLVILGFCCGLRRLEALYCQVQDLFVDRFGVPLELLIRPLGMRGLKSDNARRREPMPELLPAEELKEVGDWYKARVSQGAKPTDCLFGNAKEALDVIPQSIFEAINETMGQVTGNKAAHFHWLRHSFCNWLFLTLTLADLENPPDLFPHLHDTTSWLREGRALRQSLYRHGRATRKHAYLLAELLGHGTPVTSMRHYMHLLPWLLKLCLDRAPSIQPESALVDLASGAKRTTLQWWKKSDSRPMAIPLKLLQKRAVK